MPLGVMRRVARAGLLGLAVLVIPMTTVHADTDGLIVDDPIPDFSPTTGGKLNGPIDGGTLMEMSGSSPDDVPEALRDMQGEAQTWQDTAGTTAVAMVMVADDVKTASEMLTGALEAVDGAGGKAFETGINGTAGFTETESGLHVAVVLWRQSNYFVEVLVVSDLEAASTTNVKLLADSEAAFLRPSTGAGPTQYVPARSESTESSAAYQAGRVIGILSLVGVVVYLIVHRQRRREEERAHKERFATPPPPFTRPSSTEPTAVTTSGPFDSPPRVDPPAV
jgi:hypothetical protein